MTLAEIPHRLVRALSADAQAERAGLIGAATCRRPISPPSPKFWLSATPGVDAAPTRPPPTALLPAGWMCLRCAMPTSVRRRAGTAIPKTGIEAPLASASSSTTATRGVVGDIKYLWELNRHLHLVTLAQAHALSGDARYLA
jgi:hypothetical protein